jgi:hypothetical protein
MFRKLLYCRNGPKPKELLGVESLLVILLAIALVGGVAALDAARAATTEGGGEGELDVGLGLNAHHEGRHVDNLAAHTAG